MGKLDLGRNAFFQKKIEFSSRDDIIQDRIDRFGDKIVVDIPIERIEVRPQIRKTFDENRIASLSEDIRAKGLIHPLTAMKDPKDPHRFILLVGGNRFEAFKRLGRPTIPCIVKEFTDNDVQIKLIQLAENMQRTDINPVELADALMELREQADFTLEAIAKSVGRTIDSIKQYSRISKLSEEEKTYHISHGSTKNEILDYLSAKNKNQATKTLITNSDVLIRRKDKLELQKLTVSLIGKGRDTRSTLQAKLEAAQQFIREANLHLETLGD